jgi:hypothetical protein
LWVTKSVAVKPHKQTTTSSSLGWDCPSPPWFGFWSFSPNQTSLAPHLIAPSLHLNPSVPRPNRVPPTQKQARPHFASQNRASTGQFLFSWPKPALTRASPNCALSPPQPQHTPPQWDPLYSICWSLVGIVGPDEQYDQAVFLPYSFILFCILNLIFIYITPAGFCYSVSGLPQCLYTTVLEPKPWVKPAPVQPVPVTGVVSQVAGMV